MSGFRGALRATTGRLAGRAGVSLAGGIVGQGILVLVSPLLTRLYSPEEFGVFAVFASLSMVVSVVSALCYDRAIPMAETKDDGSHLVVLSAVLTLGTSVLIGIMASRGILTHLTPGGSEGIGIFLLLPAAVAVLGIGQALRYWMSREDRFGMIASATILQSVVIGATQVAAGFGGMGGGGLVYGYVLGITLAFLYLLRSWRRGAGGLAPSLEATQRLARRYIRFPQFMTPSAFANAAALEAPTILLAALFGPSLAGLYLLAQRVALGPVAVLSGAVAQVQYADNARLARTDPGHLRSQFLSTAAVLVLVSVPIVATVVAFSVWGVVPVFGEEWRDGGQVMAILAITIPVQIAVVPTVHFNPIERQDAFLLWNLIRLTAVGGGIVVTHSAGGGFVAVIVVVAVTTVVAQVGSAAHYYLALLRFQREREEILSPHHG